MHKVWLLDTRLGRATRALNLLPLVINVGVSTRVTIALCWDSVQLKLIKGMRLSHSGFRRGSQIRGTSRLPLVIKLDRQIREVNRLLLVIKVGRQVKELDLLHWDIKVGRQVKELNRLLLVIRVDRQIREQNLSHWVIRLVRRPKGLNRWL